MSRRAISTHQTAFVLQGGGALGAYQAGAAARLAECGHLPDIVAGISIGAINAALIAGNPPERRAAALKTFWRLVSETASWPFLPPTWPMGAAIALAQGSKGFFAPRFPPAVIAPPGDPARASFYDTTPLHATLLDLVDFELLNDGPVRLAVGAVNVASGNFTWFDSTNQRIGAEHIMASGALPPGFPPVEIAGDYFWDGGLVSNTPLQHVIETRCDARPLTIWQIDLFSARGPLPHSVWQLEAREKDIRFSSRTRMVTDAVRDRHDLASALAAHRDALPPGFLAEPAVAALLDDAARAPLTLIHLIYRSKACETGAKDYDFSRAAMQSHWEAGGTDVTRSLSHHRMQNHDHNAEGVHIFDLASAKEEEGDQSWN